MENLLQKTDATALLKASHFKSRRLFQLIVAAMLGLAVSAAANLMAGDWTNLNVHVPAETALLGALWALRLRIGAAIEALQPKAGSWPEARPGADRRNRSIEPAVGYVGQRDRN